MLGERGVLTQVPVDDIKINQRVREDLGDLEYLTSSISELGLLQPVVVRPDLTLIAGMRRLEAVRSLGWRSVPAYVVSNLEDARRALRAELDENNARLALSPVESILRARELFPAERSAAEERRQATQFGNGSEERKNGRPEERGDVEVRLAAAVGMGVRQYRQSRRIVEAAEADPEGFGDLSYELHSSRNVAGTYRHYEARKAQHDAEKLREAPEAERPRIRRVHDIEAWLRTQGRAHLVIADPPAITRDLEEADVLRRIESILTPIRREGRAYIFLGHKAARLERYLSLAPSLGVRRMELLVWIWRNTAGSYDEEWAHRPNHCHILQVWGETVRPLGVSGYEAFTAQEIPAPDSEVVVGREKPVELMSRIVRASTMQGERVLVPWAGSGEAVIAAHKLGRAVEGAEWDEGLLRRAEERGCRVVDE
jgi:ParB-like chromosome segregation protein Spo0J